MLVLQFIAVLTCTIFAGAAIYINIAEHPARMQCGTELAATVFPPSYQRAALMQAALALLATFAALAVWYFGGTVWWLVGALCIFFVVPFTFIAIMPTNNKLRSTNLDKTADSTRHLLESWGRLHLVRSVASLIASCIFLSLVLVS